MQALDLMIQAGDREIASAEQMRGDVARTLIRQVGEEFEFKPLQEVVEFHDNKRKPVKKADRVPGSYPYYGASGIADYVDNFLFEGLHLLIAEDGENIRTRKLPIAFLANGKFWVNNHAHIVKAESDTSTQYVALAIEFSDVSAYISGSSRPKITKSACQSIQIPFPPLEDQKKIVGKMQTLDTYIDSAKRSQEALKQVRQDALHALLSGDKGVRDLAELFASDEGVA
ncbi:restriction endonuclease subunit S [Corynebacterium wankanglinii]|nr:restriction endonuclease subunit S [Corynebacterium wankanglinii]